MEGLSAAALIVLAEALFLNEVSDVEALRIGQGVGMQVDLAVSWFRVFGCCLMIVMLICRSSRFLASINFASAGSDVILLVRIFNRSAPTESRLSLLR